MPEMKCTASCVPIYFRKNDTVVLSYPVIQDRDTSLNTQRDITRKNKSWKDVEEVVASGECTGCS